MLTAKREATDEKEGIGTEQLAALYDDADENGICTFYCPLEGSKSMILNDNGEVCIGLSTKLIGSAADETYCMAHELGHFHTGTYYTLQSPLELREKAEYKADAWMVRRLLPPGELRAAVQSGYREVWELAEHFGLPEQVVLRAAYIYRCKEIL